MIEGRGLDGQPGAVSRGLSSRPRELGAAATALLLGGALLASSGGLAGCATQQGTAQALTVVGAAAVIVGASIAADHECYEDPDGGGPGSAYCSPGLSRGARRAGTATALAGVGVAAAGYALQPKGPDRLQSAPPNQPTPAGSYRLLRPATVPAENAPEATAAPATGETGRTAPRTACGDSVRGPTSGAAAAAPCEEAPTAVPSSPAGAAPP